MEIAIHDRAHNLDPLFRDYATKKVASLATHFDRIHSAEVEFDTDLKKRRSPQHVVKVTLHLFGHRLSDLRAHQTGPEIRSTFDLALAKLDGELAQLKEKVQAHRLSPPTLEELS